MGLVASGRSDSELNVTGFKTEHIICIALLVCTVLCREENKGQVSSPNSWQPKFNKGKKITEQSVWGIGKSN